MFGPITRLHCLGTCCPCFESTTDHNFRLAELSLQSVPIRWIRVIVTKKDGTGGLGHGSLFDGICAVGSESSDLPGGSDVVVSSDEKAAQPTHISIDATLSIVDTRHDGPALRIISTAFVFADDDAPNNGSNAVSTSENRGVKGSFSEDIRMVKTIPLSEIACATPGADQEWKELGLEDGGRARRTGVLLKSKSSEDDGGAKISMGSRSKRLLALELVNEGDGLTRDMVVQHINTLIGWECSRMKSKIKVKDDRQVHFKDIVAGDLHLMENITDEKGGKDEWWSGTDETDSDMEQEEDEDENVSRHDNDEEVDEPSLPDAIIVDPIDNDKKVKDEVKE